MFLTWNRDDWEHFDIDTARLFKFVSLLYH